MIPERALLPESAAKPLIAVTSSQMRRLLSILLTIAFGFGPVAFAISYDDAASLPACCRRHGAHHCAMDGATQSRREGTTTFNSPAHCPLFPGHQSANPSSISAIVAWPFALALSVEPARTGRLGTPQNGESNLCTYTLRGPPATFISA